MIQNKNVLIIGDVILDIWTYTKAIGLSLETPTLKTQFLEKKYNYNLKKINNMLKLIIKLTL